MKVLITGANGFLGAWLTRRLLEEGYSVSVLLRQKSNHLELEGLPVQKIWGDVTDLESLLVAFKGQQVIFHLAGVIAYSNRDRALMERVNVQGTQNVLQAMSVCGVPELLYLSSVAAIGAGFSNKHVLNEQSVYNLEKYNFGYFETKRKSEKIITDFALQNSIRAVIVNPSTIYGAGDARKGSRSTQLKIARGKGLFYPLGGVSIVAVEDVIEGILNASKKGKSGERYILSGENLYLKEVFNQIAEAAKVKAPFLPIPNFIMNLMAFADNQLSAFSLSGPIAAERAVVATLFHWFDHSKAAIELGFNPKPAHYAIENSVRWMRDQGLLKL
jgi:dihydroflavonol-4-reductase